MTIMAPQNTAATSEGDRAMDGLAAAGDRIGGRFATCIEGDEVAEDVAALFRSDPAGRRERLSRRHQPRHLPDSGRGLREDG
ncbi:MAG: hypothetical protein OXC66_14245 [Roseovarius sp.]|nr:hypothetical protein [Roseovarius sp.]